MKDLISKQALLYALDGIELIDEGDVDSNELESLIKRLPTIEAEPIVRCKDCKHWHDPDENKWGDCYEWGGYSQEKDYCSWGERREE